MVASVYKLLRREEWARLAESGWFEGSADDKRDGFIHLSSADQLPGTLARHFGACDSLILAEFAQATLGDALRWEPARDGNLFPHLYDRLEATRISRHWRIQRFNGVYELPSDLM